MLHTWSYNMGMVAGMTAKSLNAPRPTSLDDVPCLDEILDKSENLEAIFLPSSYVEGYFTAYDNPTYNFAG